MENMPPRLVVPEWFTISQGKWLETALFPATGCKFPPVVAEWVAGKPGCNTAGRKSDFRYSSQG